jgi:hypothetical protein
MVQMMEASSKIDNEDVGKFVEEKFGMNEKELT